MCIWDFMLDVIEILFVFWVEKEKLDVILNKTKILTVPKIKKQIKFICHA